jgi:hypothetical protein
LAVDTGSPVIRNHAIGAFPLGWNISRLIDKQGIILNNKNRMSHKEPPEIECPLAGKLTSDEL